MAMGTIALLSVVQALRENHKPAIDFEDGLKTIQLLHALYKSVKKQLGGGRKSRQFRTPRLSRSACYAL